jgi:hypothetical protein
MKRTGRLALLAVLPLLFPVPQAHAAQADLSTVGLVTANDFNDVCVCGFDEDSDSFCFVADLCGNLSTCNSTNDCPSGYRCLIGSCCNPAPDAGVCSAVCDDGECVNPGVCGTYETCEPPLLVTLSAFQAEYRDGTVVLSWTTSAEIDNIGFRVLRARTTTDEARSSKGDAGKSFADVSLELVTPRILPAQGTGLAGASYTHVDGSPQKPGLVSYYLEDIDTSGKATLHGPVTVFVPEARKPARRGAR